MYNIIYMDSKDGGISSSEKQHKTVMDLARNKVLAAYSKSEGNSSSPLKTQSKSPSFSTLSFLHSNQYRIQNRLLGEHTLRSNLIQKYNQSQTSSFKQAPINSLSQIPNLQKYHSDWQKYYQKYYSSYYAEAAKKYIESEQTKFQKQQRETQTENPNQTLTNHILTQPTEEQSKHIETTLREKIQKKASSSFRLSKKHKKLIPVFAGSFAVLFLLFLQYNRLIFAPIMAYIAPGNSKDTGIVAIDPTVSEAPTADPRLLIPKLNVDVPVHFNIANDATTINNAMNHGVAQFKIPGADALPGQIGNLVITGHSAGDIYSNNQYKFIFSGLERLVDGDLIYINYSSIRYTYKVYKRETVEPTNVAALIYPVNKPILTLITCTPLGTDRYRLLVTAEQINPPSTTTQTTDSQTAEKTADSNTTKNQNSLLPANERSFFDRVWRWLTNQHD